MTATVRAWVVALATLVVLVSGGCSGSSGDPGPGACVADSECDDGLACNGAEVCAPTALDADEDGCIAGTPLCAAPQTCDEGRGECMSDCPDADGDGRLDAACGGSDCDDDDPNRFPGNTETCDDHDEDCDPTTFGDLDADEDGDVDATCCNADGATMRCGGDCRDDDPAINSLQNEVCDGFDNDCDGESDEEGVSIHWYVDGDGDGFGDADGVPVLACMTPGQNYVPNGNDCDDTRRPVNPGNPEVPGNGRDDNCNGRVDEGAIQLREAGIAVLGGTVSQSTLRLSDGRIDSYARVCRDSQCLTGGIVP